MVGFGRFEVVNRQANKSCSFSGALALLGRGYSCMFQDREMSAWNICTY